MVKRVGILHTSFVFVNVDPVIRDLFKELLPEVDVLDFVDSDLLAQVRRDGDVSRKSIERMRHLALAADAAGVDVMFSACSSLGPALDEARKSVHVPIIKVDDVMAQQAAMMGSEIGVLATVPTTLGPTASLVRRHAERLGREVHVTERLCEGAFDLLMGGDRNAHDASVLAGAKDLAQSCDVIVLAQASMARLAPMLSAETGRPVLGSPRLGVEEVARSLRTSDRQALAASDA